MVQPSIFIGGRIRIRVSLIKSSNTKPIVPVEGAAISNAKRRFLIWNLDEVRHTPLLQELPDEMADHQENNTVDNNRDKRGLARHKDAPASRRERE